MKLTAPMQCVHPTIYFEPFKLMWHLAYQPSESVNHLLDCSVICIATSNLHTASVGLGAIITCQLILEEGLSYALKLDQLAGRLLLLALQPFGPTETCASLSI